MGDRGAAVGDDHLQHHGLNRRHNETAGRGGGKAAGCFMSVTGDLLTSAGHRPIPAPDPDGTLKPPALQGKPLAAMRPEAPEGAALWTIAGPATLLP
jgi:hypothetical protein